MASPPGSRRHSSGPTPARKPVRAASGSQPSTCPGSSIAAGQSPSNTGRCLATKARSARPSSLVCRQIAWAWGDPQIMHNLLAEEGITYDDTGRVDLRRYGWEPDEEEGLLALGEEEGEEA